MIEITLEKITGNGKVHNLAGKGRGEAARKELELDRLDKQSDIIQIDVPDYLYSIATSFFLGFFSKSTKNFKNKDEFKKKYHFKASHQMLQQIEQGINRCFMVLELP